MSQARRGILAKKLNFAAQNEGSAQRTRIEPIPNVSMYLGAVFCSSRLVFIYSGPGGVAAPRNPFHSALLRSVHQARLGILAGRRTVWGLCFMDPKSIKKKLAREPCELYEPYKPYNP